MRRKLLYPAVLMVVAAGLLFAVGCGEKPGMQKTVIGITDELQNGLRFWNYRDPGRTSDRDSFFRSWHEPESKSGGGLCTWTRGESSGLILVCDTAASGRMLLGVFSPDDGRGTRHLNLKVSGHDLGSVSLPTRADTLGFRVPSGVMRRGANVLRLDVDRSIRPCDYTESTDCRELGVMVDWVFFRPDHSVDPAPNADPHEGRPTDRLDADSYLRLDASVIAGAGLRLQWNGSNAGPTDSLEISVNAGENSSVMHFAAADDSLNLDLPSSLSLDAELTVGLVGPRSSPAAGSVTLSRARLDWLQRPLNVALIIIDTLRADRLSCYGADSTSTPRIDELARDGILYENCVSQAPITGPSHASLFTSLLPTELGFVNNGQRIDIGVPVLAEFLSRRGYDTRGVISMGTVGTGGGFGRGFAEYDHAPGFAHIASADTILPHCLAQIDRLRQPFFAFWHFSDPHEPYNAHGMVEREAEVLLDGVRLATFPTSAYTPQRIPLSLPDRESTLTVRSQDRFYVRILEMESPDHMPPTIERDKSKWIRVDRLDARIGAEGCRDPELLLGVIDMPGGVDPIRLRYSREVEFVDSHVGAVLDTLRARGLYDDTLIILAADHGEDLGEHNNVGHVENLYWTLTHVPLIIKPPHGFGPTPGSRVEETVGLIDVLPTVLGVIGAPAPQWARGIDLLAGKPPRNRLQFSETHRPEAHHDRCCLRDDRYKVIHTLEPQKWELYDMAADPMELDNLFHEGDDLSESWRGKLLAAVAEINPPVSTGGFGAKIDGATQRKLEALGY